MIKPSVASAHEAIRYFLYGTIDTACTSIIQPVRKIMKKSLSTFSLLSLFLMFIAPETLLATDASVHLLDFTQHYIGYISLALFVIAYGLVIAEEQLHLRKSKPMLIAAGFIWMLVAWVYSQHGDTHTAHAMIQHNLLEFAELFLFLLAAMTYINTMDERGVFQALRGWLISNNFSLRTIYWITGMLAFLISPIADNLTTALLMSTVVMSVAGTNKQFVVIGCINIVVAANAGGAFSPFGDITTLMVWQKGLVHFGDFFSLFLPAVVNWLVPAFIMSWFIASGKPEAIIQKVDLKTGAWTVVILFIVTIAMAVSMHNFLHLPPVVGMMTGLGFLKIFGYYLKKTAHETIHDDVLDIKTGDDFLDAPVDKHQKDSDANYDIFQSLAKAEWDTLMFFYGVILCVGGLGTLGYLSLTSSFMYGTLGATNANIIIGFLSAIIDNIPVMFAVLTMMPEMSQGQWLLVTLTAGVGGSLLSIGSAAGVAVMGQARGVYTFFAHLKWSWAILLGYIASIWVHFLINQSSFSMVVK